MNNVERFKAAYDYLYSIGKTHSITEFADFIGAARSSVSKAYNGDASYLRGALLAKVVAAYPDVFNRDWMLRGEGEMLAQQAPSAPQSDVIAQLIRLCNNLHDDVRSLKMELAATKAEVEKLKRAHYGYASVAADGLNGIEEFEEVK
jgi:hypothetical protein